jgi:hypothetical protein
MKPGTEIYLDVNKHPRCPICRLMLKTHPQTTEAKEKLAIMITGKALVR